MSCNELQVMVVEDHGFQRRIPLRLLAELGVERVLGSVEKPLTRDKLEAVLGCFDEHAGEQPDDALAEFDVQALTAALHSGEIVPWFQPQVEFANGKVIGVEALARWERPDGSVVRPHQFVPVLEREGLANALSNRMLDEACRWKQHWGHGGARVKVSVNVSAMALADPSAAHRYQAIVESHDMAPQAVDIVTAAERLRLDLAVHYPG